MSDDLRALLGDKYDHTVMLACIAMIGLEGMPVYEVAVTRALAAVLPDLLADARREGQANAWDEAVAATMRYSDHVPIEITYIQNPYRAERDDHE